MLKNFGKSYIGYVSGKGDMPRSRKEVLVFQTLFAATMAFVMVLSVNLLLLYHDAPTSVSMLVSWPLWFSFAIVLFFVKPLVSAVFTHTVPRLRQAQ